MAFFINGNGYDVLDFEKASLSFVQCHSSIAFIDL